MNTKVKNASKESKRKITSSTLSQLAGLSALAAGIGFVIVGIFHPVNEPSVVTTATWINVHIVAVAMGFFGLFGMAGLYARQAEKSGLLSLAGFILFSTWLGLIIPFSFVEAFILPSLAAELPAFVEGFIGMFSGAASDINFGILPTLWKLSGSMLIIGTLLFGIATFRAGVLPRGAGALLAIGSVLIPVGAFVPPQYESLVMVPAGLALAWLGYALFSERRVKSSESLIAQGTVNMEPSQAV